MLDHREPQTVEQDTGRNLINNSQNQNQPSTHLNLAFNPSEFRRAISALEKQNMLVESEQSLRMQEMMTFRHRKQPLSLDSSRNDASRITDGYKQQTEQGGGGETYGPESRLTMPEGEISSSLRAQNSSLSRTLT